MPLRLTRTARDGKRTLYIGDNISITLLEVSGLQCKLEISAPKDVVILREELLQDGKLYAPRDYSDD